MDRVTQIDARLKEIEEWLTLPDPVCSSRDFYELTGEQERLVAERKAVVRRERIFVKAKARLRYLKNGGK